MRVIGDLDPGKFTVFPMPDKEGFSQASFFDNVQPFEEEHEGVTAKGYQYDVYTLELLTADNLAKEIESNFDNFFAAAKAEAGADAPPSELDLRIAACEAAIKDIAEEVWG